MIQYLGCGLENLYLRNGYRFGRSASGEETLHVENAPELHRAVAAWVCGLPRALTPDEFRFLRKMLGLSQRQLGALLRLEDQTIGTWERGKHPINELADRFVRAMMMERISQNPAVEALLTKLSEHDCAERWAEANRIEFEAMPEWRQAA